MDNKFVHNLKSIRKLLGLTQKQVAAKLEVVKVVMPIGSKAEQNLISRRCVGFACYLT